MDFFPIVVLFFALILNSFFLFLNVKKRELAFSILLYASFSMGNFSSFSSCIHNKIKRKIAVRKMSDTPRLLMRKLTTRRFRTILKRMKTRPSLLTFF